MDPLSQAAAVRNPSDGHDAPARPRGLRHPGRRPRCVPPPSLGLDRRRCAQKFALTLLLRASSPSSPEASQVEASPAGCLGRLILSPVRAGAVVKPPPRNAVDKDLHPWNSPVTTTPVRRQTSVAAVSSHQRPLSDETPLIARGTMMLTKTPAACALFSPSSPRPASAPPSTRTAT